MDEYIERKAAYREICADDTLSGYEKAYCCEIIKEIPSADVATVRHGRWVKRGCKWQCTNCKVLMSIDGTPKENLLNYCPNCGCLMDGGDDE